MDILDAVSPWNPFWRRRRGRCVVRRQKGAGGLCRVEVSHGRGGGMVGCWRRGGALSFVRGGLHGMEGRGRASESANLQVIPVRDAGSAFRRPFASALARICARTGLGTSDMPGADAGTTAIVTVVSSRPIGGPARAFDPRDRPGGDSVPCRRQRLTLSTDSRSCSSLPRSLAELSKDV